MLKLPSPTFRRAFTSGVVPLLMSSCLLVDLVGIGEAWGASAAYSTMLWWRLSSFNTTRKKDNGRRKDTIVVHRIRSPRLALHYVIDDLEIRIDDPDLYRDHFAEFPPGSGHKIEHDGSTCYLATWKDEPTVIGMVEVLPGWKFDEDYNKLPILEGLYLDDVVTAKKHKRKGVATALFQAIERDATELMDLMEVIAANQTWTKNQNIERLPGGIIELQLVAVKTREAFAFYRAMGFQPKAWQQQQQRRRDKHSSSRREGRESIILNKLIRRLRWGWFGLRVIDSTMLVKQLVVDPHQDRTGQAGAGRTRAERNPF